MGPELSKMIGMNLDPSHLMIQGAEPIAAARELGDKIFYVHGKMQESKEDLRMLMDY